MKVWNGPASYSLYCLPHNFSNLFLWRCWWRRGVGRKSTKVFFPDPNYGTWTNYCGYPQHERPWWPVWRWSSPCSGAFLDKWWVMCQSDTIFIILIFTHVYKTTLKLVLHNHIPVSLPCDCLSSLIISMTSSSASITSSFTISSISVKKLPLQILQKEPSGSLDDWTRWSVMIWY